MKYIGTALLGFIFGAALTVGAAAQSGLWTGGAVNFPIAATVTNAACTAPAAGVTNTCRTGTTGEQISCNGAAYIPGGVCGATPVAGVQKVQGVAPGATGNVSLNCTAPLPAVSAIFTAGTNTSAQFPAETISVNCTGQAN